LRGDPVYFLDGCLSFELGLEMLVQGRVGLFLIDPAVGTDLVSKTVLC
jgi:hypothetical protein